MLTVKVNFNERDTYKLQDIDAGLYMSLDRFYRKWYVVGNITTSQYIYKFL